MKDELLRPYMRSGLQEGWNPFLEDDPDTKIDFGVFRLGKGRSERFYSDTHETAVLVLQGSGTVTVGQTEAPFDRNSYADQSPLVAHLPSGEAVTVSSDGLTDLAVVRTHNPDTFPSRVYLPEETEDEHRGKGILDDTSYRIVRTVFDRRNTPPEVRLVVGEVINFPGRWSSYPPHHHPQPELYYYRFSPGWGYGHAELGDSVFKLRQNDLLKITGERDHAQTSAPGFLMYYLWTIRHLPDNPYTGFEYTQPFDDLLK